jgi:hypothetical protein
VKKIISLNLVLKPEDDQIIRQKLHRSVLLVLKIILHAAQLVIILPLMLSIKLLEIFVARSC